MSERTTGATEQRISNEQVHTAIIGLIDAWNDPSNHNPRTRRRYKEPWSSRLWFQFMRAGLDAVVPEGYVIARAADVLNEDQRAAIGEAAEFLASIDKLFRLVETDRPIARSHSAKLRSIANGGTDDQ